MPSFIEIEETFCGPLSVCSYVCYIYVRTYVRRLRTYVTYVCKDRRTSETHFSRSNQKSRPKKHKKQKPRPV